LICKCSSYPFSYLSCSSSATNTSPFIGKDIEEIREVTIVPKKGKKNFSVGFQALEMQFRCLQFWIICFFGLTFQMQWLYVDLNNYFLDFGMNIWLIVLYEKLILSKQQLKILSCSYWG